MVTDEGSKSTPLKRRHTHIIWSKFGRHTDRMGFLGGCEAGLGITRFVPEPDRREVSRLP